MKTANQIKGDKYEAFVLDKLKPEYDDIWLWKNVPESVLYKCGIIENYDIFCKYRNLGDLGIDIVAIKNDVPYFIQCKNFNSTILLDHLVGFHFFLHENDLKTGMLCYNGKLSQRIIDLSKRTIIRNIPYENEKVIIKQIPTVIVPKEYQIEACKFLKDKHRSILSLPCGMGKTYCACMVAEKHDNIVVISPLRELAKQNLESFSSYFNEEYHSVLISVDGERNTKKIKLGKKNIISLTYDSVDVLNKILDELKNMIIVIDEFHNISENSINGNTEMTKILKSDKKILFLSATPKHTKHKEIFGEHVFSYDWSKAIANKYINDFDIVLPSKEQTIETFDKLLKTINSEYEHNKMACKMYFLLKCILYNGNRKIIVFFATHEKMSEGIEIIGWLSKIFNIDINVDRIDCNTSCTNRTKIINIFAEIGGISILCCVRVLNEGINIQCCDAVFITQPNDNLLNLVQRMSRCIRITEDKKKSHVYIWCKDAKKTKLLEYLSSNSDCFNKKTSIVPMVNVVGMGADEPVKQKENNPKIAISNVIGKSVIESAKQEENNPEIGTKNEKPQIQENNLKCNFCDIQFRHHSSLCRHKKFFCRKKKEMEEKYSKKKQDDTKKELEYTNKELEKRIANLETKLTQIIETKIEYPHIMSHKDSDDSSGDDTYKKLKKVTKKIPVKYLDVSDSDKDCKPKKVIKKK